jgi:hypothetical protein
VGRTSKAFRHISFVFLVILPHVRQRFRNASFWYGLGLILIPEYPSLMFHSPDQIPTHIQGKSTFQSTIAVLRIHEILHYTQQEECHRHRIPEAPIHSTGIHIPTSG